MIETPVSEAARALAIYDHALAGDARYDAYLGGSQVDTTALRRDAMASCLEGILGAELSQHALDLAMSAYGLSIETDPRATMRFTHDIRRLVRLDAMREAIEAARRAAHVESSVTECAQP